VQAQNRRSQQCASVLFPSREFTSPLLHAGDDSVAIHGRMYTVAAANQTAMTITAASGIISPAELNKGDRMNVYDPTGRLLGQVGVVSVAYVNAPPGVGPTTPDPVFQTTFSGYSYLQVSSTSLLIISPVQVRVSCDHNRAHRCGMSLHVREYGPPLQIPS
jgi:hypothetical protein